MKRMIIFRFALYLLLVTSSLCYSHGIVSETDSLQGDHYFTIAEKFYSENLYDSSSIYYLEAGRFYYKEKQWAKYLISLNYSAIDFTYLSEYKRAEEILQSAILNGIEIFGEEDSLTAVLFNSLGSVYYNFGDYESALECYGLGLKIREKIFGDDHTDTANSLHNIGLVWNYMGDHEKALEYFNKALATWYPLYGNNNSSLGNCYINIANTYAAIGNYEKSIEFDLKALETWKNVLGEDHRYIAMSYNNLSESYETIGQYEKSLEYVKKSIELNRDIFGEDHPQMAKNLTLLAKINKSKGDLNAAEIYINQAFEIWNEYPTDLNRNSTLFQLADLNIKKSNYTEAKANYDSILVTVLPEVLESDFYPEDQLNLPIIKVSDLYALSGKGEAYLKKYLNTDKSLNDLKESFYWYDLYSRILNGVRKNYRRERTKLNFSRSLHVNNAKLINVAFELYKTTGEINYKSLAFSLSANSKAVVLSDAIEESGAKEFGQIPDSLLTLERRIKEELESSFERLEYAKEDSSLISEINSKIFQLNKSYDELIRDYEVNFPVYYNLKYKSPEVNVEEIQNNFLDSSSALIEYFISDSIAFIFVITQSDFHIEKISITNLNHQVIKLRNSLQNLEFEEYLNSGFELYRLLIQPFSDLLYNKNRIYLIPDGILSYVPFEALLSKKVGENDDIDFSMLNYLINDFEFIYYYSSSLIEAISEEYLSTSYAFAGIAPVFSDSGENTHQIPGNRSVEIRNQIYSSLPYTEKEVEEISKLFDEKNLPAKTFTHSEATEQLIKSDSLKNYNIIHIATHGFINEEKPKLSGIVFWEDERSNEEDAVLHIGEIFNLDLESKLLVLSACESGLGKYVRGEGIIGMTRGFIYAGAENIVISLWQVADKSTSELMVDFYKNILSGNNYSSSLRNAKLRMIKEKKYAYPLEWSPFIIVSH